MRGLPLLIRMARQRADERRVILVEAESQTRLAAEVLAGQETHLRRETERARGEPEAMAMWSDWSRVAAGRQRHLRQALTALQAQEEQIRDCLREDFAEIKRLEIARDAAAKAARREAGRRAERTAEDAELRRRR